MINLIQFMKTECADLQPIINFIKHGVFPLIQFAIPVLLIVMGSIDLGKAVLSSDDKEIKAATSKLVKRAIAAVAVFFIPFIVNLLIRMVKDPAAGGRENVFNCWNADGKITSKDKS